MTRTLNAAATGMAKFQGDIAPENHRCQPESATEPRKPRQRPHQQSDAPPFLPTPGAWATLLSSLLDPTQAPNVTEGRLNASAMPASGSPKTRVAVKSV